jgi:hypothetical protein
MTSGAETANNVPYDSRNNQRKYLNPTGVMGGGLSSGKIYFEQRFI